jgi:DnaD/phage-associated family protein
MSGKIMGSVWDLDLPRNKAFVLLAMADHADHTGRNVYPSFGLIAWKTGYSYRQVLRIVKELESDGILVLERAGKDKGTSNRYRINLAAGSLKPEYNAKDEQPGEGYDIIVSHPSDDVTKPDEFQSVIPGVTPLCHTWYDTQESHEPSNKPSIEPPLQQAVVVEPEAQSPEQQTKSVEIQAIALAKATLAEFEPAADDQRSTIFKVYEQNIGPLTPMIGDQIKAAETEYPEGWIADAIRVAVAANHRSWRYIEGILKNWMVDGKDSGKKPDTLVPRYAVLSEEEKEAARNSQFFGDKLSNVAGF